MSTQQFEYSSEVIKLTRQVGERIRKVREQQNCNQSDLARKINMTQASISQIERGHRKQIKPSVLAQIAEALDTPIDYFIAGDETRHYRTCPSLRHIMLEIIPSLPVNQQEEIGNALQWLLEWRYGILSSEERSSESRQVAANVFH